MITPILAAAFGLALSHVDGPGLSLGSKAPLPDISDYVRGTKPAFFEPGKTYVIEFWATWCPPCRASMPHLSQLADTYKDKVVVLGVSDEPVQKVTTFLNQDEWKQKARYTLATDPDHSTHDAYMKAAGQSGIPTAFIVKEGVVQWIGHPMTMDEPLSKIVAGTWDVQAAKKDFDAALEAERKSMARQEEIAKAYEDKDWPTVLKLMDQIIADSVGPEKSMQRLNKAQVLLVSGKTADGYALIEEVLKPGGEPDIQMMAAGVILRTPDLKDRRVDAAIGYLEQALKATGPVAPQILAELGYAWSLKGDLQKACDFTQRAMEAAKSWGPSAADYVVELELQLKGYKAKASGTTQPPASK